MARRLLPGIFLIALLAASAGATPVLDRAAGLAAAGNREAARAVLDSLLVRTDPKDAVYAEASYRRALLEENGKDLERRLRVLVRSEKDAGRRAAAQLILTRLAMARGEYAAAASHAREAIKDGRREEGSLGLGLATLAEGEFSAARPALEDAARSGNSAIRQRAWVALGDLHRLAGRNERALAWYDRLAEEPRLGPGWWATAAWRGAACLEALGRMAEARERLVRLVERLPDAYEAPLARRQLHLLETPVGPAIPEPPAEAAGSAARLADTAGAYAIQVGAFSVEQHARDLAAEMRAKGFPEVRLVARDGIHRVYIGRFATREEAESLGDSLIAVAAAGFSIVPLTGAD